MKHKQGQRLFRRPFWTAERAGFPLRPESYGYFSIFFARVQVFLCKLAHFIQLWSKIQQPALIGQGIGPYGTRHSPSPRRNGACPSAAPRSSAHRGRPASPQARPCLKRRDREPVSPTRSSAAAGYRLPVQSSGDPSALTAYHSFLAGSRLTLKDHVVDVFILTHLIPDTVLLLTKHRHVDLSFPWERHFIISGNKNATAALLQTMAEKIRLNWKNKIFGGHPRSCWLLCTVCTHRLQSHLPGSHNAEISSVLTSFSAARFFGSCVSQQAGQLSPFCPFRRFFLHTAGASSASRRLIVVIVNLSSPNVKKIFCKK